MFVATRPSAPPGLGAGPRAAPPRQLSRLAVRAAARDTAGSGPDGCRGPAASLDTADSTANAANVVPLVDRIHCNNALADDPAKTAVRILSADNAAADGDSALAPRCCEPQNDFGPRELLLPTVKSRSEASTSLRGVSSRPLLLAFHSLLLYHMSQSRDQARAPCTRPWRAFVTLSERC